MPEFNIDQIKKTWQEHPTEQKYGDEDILNMLNKNSTNYVKYILWISAVEFFFFLSLTIYYLFNNEDIKQYLKMFEQLGVKNDAKVLADFDVLYMGVKILSLIVTAIFVYKFYINYKKIKVESNLKKFIFQIIRFKKTVNLFIFVNIMLLSAFTLALFGFLYYTLQHQNVEIPKETSVMLLFVLAFTIIFSGVLIWLYYRIVYGILLRKLSIHLKQLKEIEIDDAE